MALTITNDELRSLIGRELGYSRTVSAWSSTQASDVETCLKAGLRRFYDPEIIEGMREKHQWSFLTPTVHWDFTSGQHRYDLPDDFAMLNGPIHYEINSATIWPPVDITAIEHLERRLQQTSLTGRPYLAAYRVKQTDDVSETRYELLCYPIPAADYAATLRYKLNPLAPRATGQLPVGDQAHMQTIIEACLSAAEDFDNRVGVHDVRYHQCLRSSISHDQQVRSPSKLGYNHDRSDCTFDQFGDLRDMDSYVVAYGGVTYQD